MIKKNNIGDYIASCDRCTYSDFIHFYDFRKAQEFYKNRGWYLKEDGTTYCTCCRGKVECTNSVEE